MGTSRTPRELARKLEKIQTNLEATTRTAPLAAAQQVKDSVLRRTTAATGGDLRLSGVRSKRSPKGAKLGVQYDGRGKNVLVRATGPFQLVENDTPPHDIWPRRSGQQRPGVRRRRRTTGAKALAFGDGVYASAKATGGSRGRQPWANGVRDAMPAVRRQFAATERQAIRAAVR